MIQGTLLTCGQTMTLHPTAENYRQFGAAILNQAVVRYVVNPADSLVYQNERRFLFESELALVILLELGWDVGAFLAGLQRRRDEAQDLLACGSLAEWKAWRRTYFPYHRLFVALDGRFK